MTLLHDLFVSVRDNGVKPMKNIPPIMRRAIRSALIVRKEYGKGLISQAFELAKYYLKEGRLGQSDYYKYRLFDDEFYTPEMKAEFVGWRMEVWLDKVLNDVESRGAANDKLQFYALMQASGFQSPKIYAIYHPLARSSCGAPSFDNPESLEQFLREEMKYPVFTKPVHSDSARGTCLLTDFDVGTDELIHHDGTRVGLHEFVASIHDPRGLGYLFLEFLRPHEHIAHRCGDRLSALRVIVIVKPDGAKVIRAVWKVQTGDNIHDHFGRTGKTGNLCASIDMKTGRIGRVVGRVGLEQTEYECHPDTGQNLIGFQIPHWKELLSASKTAALVYPKLHFQHWDIAITGRGPVMLECNVNGGFGSPQLASGRGLYDTELRELVRWRCEAD